MWYKNFNLQDIVTPVRCEEFKNMLIQANYNSEKTQKLYRGFKNGFSLGYQEKQKVRITSYNLALRVGNITELWNKVMKEVKDCRYAGPFENPPFDYFIQ